MIIRQNKSGQPLPLRVVAPFAILLLAMLFLIGGNLAAMAACPAAPLAAACPPFSPGEEEPVSACQNQDCLCLCCLTLPPARLAELACPPLLAALRFAPLLPRPLAAFVRHLDYPPEPA